MATVRLHHPYLSVATLVFELEKPYFNRLPRLCPECQRAHANKSLHLRLDAAGDVMVSDAIWAKHRDRFTRAGLELANEVIGAPAMRIGAVMAPQRQIVELHLNGHRTNDPLWVPERSRQRSAEAMRRPLVPIIDAHMEKLDRKATAEKAKRRRIIPFGRRK